MQIPFIRPILQDREVGESVCVPVCEVGFIFVHLDQLSEQVNLPYGSLRKYG